MILKYSYISQSEQWTCGDVTCWNNLWSAVAKVCTLFQSRTIVIRSKQYFVCISFHSTFCSVNVQKKLNYLMENFPFFRHSIDQNDYKWCQHIFRVSLQAHQFNRHEIYRYMSTNWSSGFKFNCQSSQMKCVKFKLFKF